MLPGPALYLALSRGNVAYSPPSKRPHSVVWARAASGSTDGVCCGCEKAVGSWNIVFQDPTARGLAPGPCGFRGQTVECVVAVSYSPTPSQVQYHRRLRA